LNRRGAQPVLRSGKGRENLQPFIERVMAWLIENYAPPEDALDPEAYQHWLEMAQMVGTPTTYIGYLQEIGMLP
jgi:hypothetical protein